MWPFDNSEPSDAALSPKSLPNPDLTHSWGDKEVSYFSKGISLKRDIFASLRFQLYYFEAATGTALLIQYLRTDQIMLCNSFQS